MNRDTATSYRGATFSERMAAAPCLTTDPEVGFTVKEGGATAATARTATAKKVCAPCPIETKQECLELAMRTEGSAAASMRHGVFGGLDGDERAALARERKEAAS